MLKIKIGNTYVSATGVEIPVVLRSSIFSEGKGSYIFNFQVYATPELKKELDYYHRPGSKVSSSLSKPLWIKKGPLQFSGTATVKEAGDKFFEVSCPIDNGEMAQLFKSMKLSEIDLGGVRDAEIGSISLDTKPSENLVVDTSGIVMAQYFDLPMDDIIQNPELILNSGGDEITMDFTGKIFFLLSLSVNRIHGALYFQLFINGDIYQETSIDTGDIFMPLEIDVTSGDVITWQLKGQASADLQWAYFGLLKFTVYSEGTKLQLFKDSNMNDNEGLTLYPDSDYACFPFENSKMFDKLEDDTYQIDHVSIKEVYSKYFPIINYYKENRFPSLMSGESEGKSFLAFNLFNPFPYLAYVIKQMAKDLGINFDNNLFEEPDQKQLVIFNLFAENSFITSELIQPKVGFNLKDHVPDVQLSDYWINLCKLLGIAFDYRPQSKKLRLKYLKDIAADTDFLTFPGKISTTPELSATPYKGFRLTQASGGDDFIKENFKSLDGLNYKGTVKIVASLGNIVDPAINDCYFVIRRKEYWYYNYDPEFATLNWMMHSKDFFFEYEQINEDIDGDLLEIKTSINPLMDNGFDYLDLTLSAVEMRLWLIPKTLQAGNFDGLPDYFKSEFTNSLVFYHGLRYDSNNNLYPLASCDIYDFAGDPITFESVGSTPAYTHSLSLRWDGPNGLYEKRYKAWLDILMKSRGSFTFTAYIDPADLATIDLLKWYSAPGFKFMIKEIRFTLTEKSISVAELDVLVR